MTIALAAEQKIGAWLMALSRLLAYGGGAILTLLAIMTVISVIGRYLTGFGLGPIKGDFELVEMGCAIAIFSFLPLAQMKRAHVTVDVFITRLPARGRAFLGFLGDSLIALAAFIMFWQFWLSFGEKFPYGVPGLRAALGMGPPPFFAETTYELEIEIWVPYALGLIGAGFFCVVGFYSVWRSLNWTLQGQEPQL